MKNFDINTVKKIEYWTIQGRNEKKGSEWEGSNVTYDEDEANYTFRKFKKQFKTVRMIHHVLKNKVVKKYP